MLWLDFDVAFRQPSGGALWAELARFVQLQDVTYIPFKPHTLAGGVVAFGNAIQLFWFFDVMVISGVSKYLTEDASKVTVLANSTEIRIRLACCGDACTARCCCCPLPPTICRDSMRRAMAVRRRTRRTGATTRARSTPLQSTPTSLA